MTVVDQTDHAEQVSQALPVAAQPLVIEAVAESGRTNGVRVLKPGVENIIYILTSYPDGRPAPTQLQIRVDGGEPTELTSGEFGLTEFNFTPQSGSYTTLEITAQDETGLRAERWVGFEAEYGSDSVLLRADRAAYVVGETMNLVAFTPVEFGDVYLDIVKSGQTLSTRSARVTGGNAGHGRVEFAVDVSPDLYGTLELHAYKVLLDGTIVRDTRLVVVDEPNDVAIDITPDKEAYLPGEMATIDFQTSDAGEQGGGGEGVQTALGLAIVDESVFALQRQDPGFAKLYFMLEQELLEPFYQIKGFELPAATLRAPEKDVEQIQLAQDEAAKANWAGAGVLAAPRPINSRQEKMTAVREAQDRGYTRIGRAYVAGLILIPLALWAVVIAALWKTGVVRRSLVRLVVVSVAIAVLGGCLVGWFLALTEIYYDFDPEVVFILLALAIALAVLLFIGHALVRGDTAARFLALLTLAWPLLLFLLVLVSDYGYEPSDGLLLVAMLAYALVPGAYLLFGQVRWVQEKRFVGVLSTGLGTVSALPAMAIPLALLFFLMPMRGAMAPPPTMDRQFGLAPPPGVPGLAPMPTMVVEEIEKKGAVDVDVEVVGAEAPRLRQYFPETLYWAPEILTDEDGFVSLEIPMADSITTWRLTALASSQDGRLGFTTRGLRVFQDFFVDIDLPVALTQGDEISIPIGVFNYLPEAQEVRLVVEQEDWFELLGDGEQTMTIESNDIDVVYFPIRVLKFGRRGFQVTACGAVGRPTPPHGGEHKSDAIRREVNVVPDGKEFRLTESDWLRESKEVKIDIPTGAVPETPYVEVKIYPGVMAQAVEGLEKILRLPHG